MVNEEPLKNICINSHVYRTVTQFFTLHKCLNVSPSHLKVKIVLRLKWGDIIRLETS